MKRVLIIHYGEIGLKKANKDYFVNKLRKSIKMRLEKKFRETFSVKCTLGRLLVDLPDGFKEEGYVDVLRKIFGIKNFKFTYIGSTKVNKIGAQILENMPKFEKKPNDFRVKVKRSMDLPYKSIEAEREIGAILLENGIDMKVKLKNPEFVVDIELFNNNGYFSYKTYRGQGGLSPNSQGKLVSLISSGIDSPVASFQMMRRGARVVFVHFHGYPYTDKDEMHQSKEIVKILSEYQFDTKMYLVPFGEIQKKIAVNSDVPAKVRTVLYRRLMIRIAESIAKKERAKGLITGDNYGQVASQTPENMFAIHEASSIPLFQPLISLDKEDIIRIAEEIETFEISKLPCKDSCSMFMPKHPELKANIYDLHKIEEHLPIADWVVSSIEESEVVYF
ncbi:MAG: tRNA uracil 4-sulfurtransferase ThiI [Nitrospirota bacterium]